MSDKLPLLTEAARHFKEAGGHIGGLGGSHAANILFDHIHELAQGHAGVVPADAKPVAKVVDVTGDRRGNITRSTDGRALPFGTMLYAHPPADTERQTISGFHLEKGASVKNLTVTDHGGWHNETRLYPADTVRELVEALEFYADPQRYEGPNQRPTLSDKWTPEDQPYRQDVTRDHGAIARAALAKYRGQSSATAKESA